MSLARARALARRSRAARSFSALPKLKAVPANDALPLLEATAAFVPQALADDPRQLSFWNTILSGAIADIRAAQPRPARLVVGGTDTAAARDLVTVLLEEPFTSDPQQAPRLRQRWATAPPEQTSLTIEYGNTPAEGSLRLPLAYLDQFPLPLQVVEAADPAALHTADVAVFVARLDELYALNITRLDSLVVLNIDAAETQPRASTSRSAPPPARYLFVSPSQALSALKALKESPASPEAVQRYQTAFLASRVPTLTQSLHAILASLENASMLRNRTALSQIRSALVACRAAIDDARAELDRVADSVSDLEALLEEERVKVHREIFGPTEDSAIDRAVEAATSLLRMKIGYMKWWRAMWTTDELTTYLTQTVQRVWCTGLEKELTFHAGRLERMQRSLNERAFALVAPANTRSLHSPVLYNALHQLTATPAFSVAPSSLAAPLAAGATQIIEVPTARLHVTAQRALLGMGGATGAGALISWSGWVGFLMNADGILGSWILEPGSAMATGILVALSGVHWASRRWNNGRKHWAEDVERVGGGMKQDLSKALDETMENQVLLVARTGCSELSKKLGQRKTELDRLQEQLDTLSTAAEHVEQRK